MRHQAIAGIYRVNLKRNILAMINNGMSRGKITITLQDREIIRDTNGLSYNEIQSIVDRVFNQYKKNS